MLSLVLLLNCPLRMELKSCAAEESERERVVGEGRSAENLVRLFGWLRLSHSSNQNQMWFYICAEGNFSWNQKFGVITGLMICMYKLDFFPTSCSLLVQPCNKSYERNNVLLLTFETTILKQYLWVYHFKYVIALYLITKIYSLKTWGFIKQGWKLWGF